MVNSNNNISLNQQYVATPNAARSPMQLPRILSPLETCGFGITGTLGWISAAPPMHAALGPGAIFVWFPGVIIGMFLNFQVKRLGEHWPEMSGGTANYATRLLRNYPGLGRYVAIAYYCSWAVFPAINALLLIDLIKANLAPLGLSCPETILKIGFTVVPFIVAFSGTRALSILHLFFILPAVGFLLVFCTQGIGWLLLSPDSPGFFPKSLVETRNFTSLSFIEWAKWFFYAIYGTCSCETASSFVADSKRPSETLRFLSLAAWLIPIVYLGASWVLLRLATSPELGDNPYTNLLAAAMPFWGESASLLITLLLVSGCLLLSATSVSNSPRVLYQLALDGHLSPVFSVVSKPDVLLPGLVLTCLLSLIALAWGDLARLIMVVSAAYLISIMTVHLALWLRRGRPEVLWPWLAGGFFLVEAIALVVGGLSWSWQDLLLGLLSPIPIIVADAAIRRISFPPFHPAWWLQFYRSQGRQIKDFVAFQVVVLIVLVCSATTIGWVIRDKFEQANTAASNNLLVVVLMSVAFVAIAVACWTSLPQVGAIAEAREQAQNLFITALDTVLDTILVLDENGVIRQTNPAAEELFGMNINTLIGHPLKEFFPGLADGPNHWPSRSEQTLQRHVGTSQESSLRIIEATISQRKNQNFQEYILILRDITERKQDELALQQANAYLTAIIDNLADGLLVTDTDGVITRLNRSLLPMFNIRKTDLIGQDCNSVFSSEVADLVAQTKRHPQEVFTVEIELAGNRDGKAVGSGILKDGVEDATDACIGSVILIRDITAEKEVDRMKTDFISTVSHELRTPLTSVLGFAKLIKKKLEDTVFPLIMVEDKKTQRTIKQVGDNINIIVSEGERLTSLINDVLDIAKMEAGKIDWQMQPVLVEEIIDRAIAATSSLVEAKRLEMIKDIEPGLPEVVGDRDRLLQVAINLISNAIKFTETGSVTLKVRQQDNHLVISVIDTGIGIALDDQPKVFERFKQVGDTLTDKPKGTGLGLPICKQIVEHHGGRIWVESQLHEGSTFSFTLPLITPSNSAIERLNIDSLVRQLKENVATVTPSRNEQEKTILVVDDDAHIRDLLRQELESSGYEVKEAKDGMDALTQIKTAKPDLIILDVMMPQISGFDVAAVLKTNPETMGIPIIILSIIEDKQTGFRLGIDRYLTKPVNTEGLLDDIGLLISQGTSQKKVLILDKDASTVRTLSEVLQAQGYSVVETSNNEGFIENVLSLNPDMIIVDSVFSQQYNLIKLLRFEKDLENVFFVLRADSQGGSKDEE
jgi:PAS domain S-box-containing protein